MMTTTIQNCDTLNLADGSAELKDIKWQIHAICNEHGDNVES